RSTAFHRGSRPCRRSRHRSAALAAKRVSDEEAKVGRPLGEAAHEIGEPLGPERRRDEHFEAAAGKVELELRAHAVEHLELEAVARYALRLREGDRVLDEALVVGR